MFPKVITVTLFWAASLVSSAQTKKVIIVPLSTPVVADKSSSPFGEDALEVETVRTYLRLTSAGEIYRQSWLRALDLNKSKGAPYWPASFWDDVRKDMIEADLSPMVLKLYESNIRDSQLKIANEFLTNHTLSEFVSSPDGAELCRLQAVDDKNSSALTLEFTQKLIQRAYEQHKIEIRAAREKYLRDHPEYKD
jgi:hypothetical protein